MKRCAECGKELEWVGSGPEWMNSYQWDAVKAGDYFAECDKAVHANGNCYFWKKDSDVLAPGGRAALEGPVDSGDKQ